MAKPPRGHPGDRRMMLDRAGPYPLALGPYDANVGALRVDWHRRRQVILDRHIRVSRLQVDDPVKCQERHSPTVEISVDDSEGSRRARRNLTRVRLSEAWRYHQLSATQRQAETEMHRIWSDITAGLRPPTGSTGFGFGSKHNPTRLPSDDLQAARSDAEARWRAWHAHARRKKIATSVVIDCLAALVTLRDIEKAHHKSNGWALDHYRKGLDLWGVLRGWLPVSYRLGA